MSRCRSREGRLRERRVEFAKQNVSLPTSENHTSRVLRELLGEQDHRQFASFARDEEG